MGAYASWSALAMTHHMLIRYAAYALSIKDPLYVVLGDDVAIANKAVAAKYLEYVKILGLTISKGKSVIPENHIHGKTIGAEFAKRVIVDGDELTPMSPVELSSIFKNREVSKF